MLNTNAPGVYLNVIDQTQYTPGTATSTLALIGKAMKGPLNQPIFITNLSQLISTFGFPSRPSGTSTVIYNSLQAAVQYLVTGNSMYFVRANNGAALATSTVSTWTAGSAATATATISGYVTPTVTVSTPGSLYTSPPTVTFSGGGGGGAAGIAVLGTGGTAEEVVGVTITNPGSGYSSAPTIAFSGGGGSGAVATCTISASVTSISVTSAGTGYNSIPYISIAAPASGTTAQASANINGTGGVGPINVTYGGTGYTTAPTVTVESAVIGANTPGLDGNNISYSISNGSAVGTFKITVSYLNPFTEVETVVETFDNLSISGSVDNVTPFVNGISQYITVYPGNATTNGTSNSATLSGGTDGTTGDSDYIGVQDGTYSTGLQTLLDTNTYQIDLVAIPDSQDAAVIAALQAFSTTRKDCLAIIDPPANMTPQNVIDWSNGLSVTIGGTAYQISKPNAYEVAIYWPWTLVYDAYSNTSNYMPPSGVVSQAIAESDSVSYPWYAPAGPIRGLVQNVLALQYNPTDGDRSLLAGNLNSVNPLVVSPVFGPIIMDQVTTYRQYADLHNINVARLVMYLRRNLKAALLPFQFAPNIQSTWNSVIQTVSPLLAAVEANSGLSAYTVICDSTNNTPLLQSQGILVVTILATPVNAVRQIQINLTLTKSAVTVA